MLAAAADLRRRGSRPVPPTLRAAVDQACAAVDLVGVPVDLTAAGEAALAGLRAIVGT
jgi:hypothetical protein